MVWPFASRFLLTLLCLAWAGAPASAAVRITEILADNDGLLHDQDDESPDWIELCNTSPNPVNLEGWRLTDDPAKPAKWVFPATMLAAGEYRVVFASGKNRAVPGAELHTNFQLQDAGGYLALVAPDGTVAQEFTYLRQNRNISFGFGQLAATNTLVAAGAPARIFVPANDSLALAWTAPEFDDSSWFTSNAPIGFALGSGTNVLLALDFNARSGDSAGNTQPGFSSFVLGGTSVQSGALTRAFGPYAVTLSNSASAFVYDDRLRATPVNSGAFTEAGLLRDFIFSRDQSGASGLDVAIAGLTPGQLCAVTVWSFDSGSPGARGSDWFANGAPVKSNYTFDGRVLPTNNEACRFTFPATANPEGVVLVSGRRDLASVDGSGTPSFGVFLNALQLASLAPPALPTNGLASLMVSNNATLYARMPFVLPDPARVTELRLRIQYNDGFVAYLNGRPVAARNAPALPRWNSTALAPLAAAAREEVPIVPPPGLLVAGANLLALQGLNASAENPDFLLDVQLFGLETAAFPDRFFAPPTPGAPNDPGWLGVAADTKFSVDRGFFDAPFTLSITCATPGSQIWFTTNGSPPAPGQGWRFTNAISIAGQSFIRAAAFKTNWLPSHVDTHSYIFVRDVLRQSNNLPSYPTLWPASYPADYAMDSNIVHHPRYGPELSNDLRAIPSLSIVTEHDGLWGPTRGLYNHATSVHNPAAGQNWERAASAELIEPDGATAFAVNCALRMQGNASRDNVRTPKHPFRLLFNSDYGPAKLRHPWFAEGTVSRFDNIALRACFTDSWSTRYSDQTLIPGGKGTRYRPEDSLYLRDVWMRDSWGAMGYISSLSSFVHLYINGLYWGLYNPSERLDASFFAGHAGGFERDWDIIVGDETYDFGEVRDGNKNDWNQLMALVNAGVTTEAAYNAIAQRVDLTNLVDYMILHFHAEAEDWPSHNWCAAHRRANPTNGLPATPWVFAPWDQEIVCDQLVTRDRVSVNNSDTPARIYSQLRAWPEFRRFFGDRTHALLFNHGWLSASNCAARFQARAAQIQLALVGESARWGDAREFAISPNPGTGLTFTRDEWWTPELQKLCTNWLPRQTGITLQRLRTATLYPKVGAPEFSQFGGGVPAGYALALAHTNAAGVIFFTLDGSDPRVYGSGAVAPGAQAYDQPIVLNRPTLVSARVLSAGQWSALAAAMFYPPQDLSALALTELMYNPPALGATNGDEFEFLELQNTGANVLDLSGLTFTAGINFTFTNGTRLAAGQFFLLARNPVALAAQYPGLAVQGIYTGKLDNGGETLTLAHPLGGVVFSLTYDDAAPWPVAPDNFGFSLVAKQPGLFQASEEGGHWRASAHPGGSPGTADPAPNIPPILINEILSASAPPAVDAIELYNPTAAAADLGGWFLTDDPAAPQKYRLPAGTTIPAGGFLVVDEAWFNASSNSVNNFSLSARGEQVYLFSGDAFTNLTGYSHGFSFGPAEDGVTFGRFVNSVGEEQFPAQGASSFGRPNAGPRVGPVVINEIHYHPESGGDEFIELKNITAAPVELFDPACPANTWRLSGLGYSLPTNLVIAPEGLLLLVATNPADFRLKYQVPDQVPVLGPWAGRLQDSGERLRLERPGAPDTNGVPFITIDELRYNDKAPWPPAADGAGASLQRQEAAAYANDPINWVAADPTPGRENYLADADADGLPDAWELAEGTLLGMEDTDTDPDGDGLSNLGEYRAGTHPHDPASVWRIQSITRDPGADAMILSFTVSANHACALETSIAIDPAAWQTLARFPALPAARVLSFTNTLSGATRFFRLVIPAP